MAVEGERVLVFIVLGAARVEHLYVDPVSSDAALGACCCATCRPSVRAGSACGCFSPPGSDHGFGIVETTDGAGTAQREPDARMASPSASHGAAGRDPRCARTSALACTVR